MTPPLTRDQAGRDLLWTIVGVVDHARRYGVHEDGRPQLYVRAEDGSRPFMWVLRSHGDPQSLIREVRAAVRRTDCRRAGHRQHGRRRDLLDRHPDPH